MAKYNLLLAGEKKYYVLHNEIIHNYVLPENRTIYNDMLDDLYQEIMKYLEEDDPTKIILIGDERMENEEDYKDFTEKYCPKKDVKERLMNTWFYSFKGKNKDGEKYIWMKTDDDKVWVAGFTENFLNKYINKKGK